MEYVFLWALFVISMIKQEHAFLALMTYSYMMGDAVNAILVLIPTVFLLLAFKNNV